jgi:hypothetical protein
LAHSFFGITDLLSAFFWLMVLLYLGHKKRNQHREDSHYKYYLLNLYFKFFFGLAFGLFYILLYNGGDTVAYWDGAVKLNNLFFSNPMAYFEELFTDSSTNQVWNNFNLNTGYPPGWIYREGSSFFVSKVASILSFVTFKSYLALLLIFCYISAMASWKLFELVRSFKLNTDKMAALACLFIPSVSFWCAGISKDTIVLISVFYFLHYLFRLLQGENSSTVKSIIVLLFYVNLLYHVRSFMIVALLVPLFFALSTRISKKFKENKFKLYSIRLFVGLIGIASILYFFQAEGTNEAINADSYLQQAEVIQQDLTNNQAYGSNRYDLGITDFSLGGMLFAFPRSVIAGFYQPFPWQALSPTLFLNGIESALLIYFTFVFFSSSFRAKFNLIKSNEFLIFAFFFAIILAYFAGFTSVLYGILVRFKAPIIPFLVILLTLKVNESKQKA